MTTTIVPLDRLTHMHWSSDSRDCDGRYERDSVWIPNANETFRDMWNWFVGSLASRDYDIRPEVERSTRPDGLPCVEYRATTEEGYRCEYAYGCDDDCDPRASRYRDHTAESMGY